MTSSCSQPAIALAIAALVVAFAESFIVPLPNAETEIGAGTTQAPLLIGGNGTEVTPSAASVPLPSPSGASLLPSLAAGGSDASMTGAVAGSSRLPLAAFGASPAPGAIRAAAATGKAGRRRGTGTSSAVSSSALRGAASGIATAASVFDGGFSVAFPVAGADAAAAAFAGGTSLPVVAGAAAGLVAGVFRSAAFFFNASSASTFFSTKLLMTSKGELRRGGRLRREDANGHGGEKGEKPHHVASLCSAIAASWRAAARASKQQKITSFNAEGAALVASRTLATAIRAARSAGKP